MHFSNSATVTEDVYSVLTQSNAVPLAVCITQEGFNEVIQSEFVLLRLLQTKKSDTIKIF